MTENQLKVLQEICKGMSPQTSKNFSFNQLSRDVNLPKDKLDATLRELDMEGYITEFVVEGKDDFKVSLNQKGFDYGQV